MTDALAGPDPVPCEPDLDVKEKAGRPKDMAALPVLGATLAETLKRT